MGAMTAFASPENPTNEEVMTALHVQRRSLSGSNITPCRRMERNALTVATCSIIPYRTPTIHNMLDLKAAVHDIFTDSLASFIISGNKMYRQADNKLFVAPAAKKANPLKGTPTYSLSRPSSDRIVVTAKTPVYAIRNIRPLSKRNPSISRT